MNKQFAPIVGEVVELGSGYSPEVQPAIVSDKTDVMPLATDESRSWSNLMKSIPATGQNIA
jgi:hypothetical protein